MEAQCETRFCDEPVWPHEPERGLCFWCLTEWYKQRRTEDAIDEAIERRREWAERLEKY